MEDLSEVLSKVTEFLKSEAKTETIIGEQFQLGEFTCVPVMSVGIGFGGGKGEGKGNAKGQAEGEGNGVGGGAGVGMGPVGFLVTHGSNIQFVAAHANKGLGAIIDKMPDLIERFMSNKTQPQKS